MLKVCDCLYCAPLNFVKPSWNNVKPEIRVRRFLPTLPLLAFMVGSHCGSHREDYNSHYQCNITQNTKGKRFTVSQWSTTKQRQEILSSTPNSTDLIVDFGHKRSSFRITNDTADKSLFALLSKAKSVKFASTANMQVWTSGWIWLKQHVSL